MSSQIDDFLETELEKCNISGRKREKIVVANKLSFFYTMDKSRYLAENNKAMIIKYTDYNNSTGILEKVLEREWNDLNEILSSMPLFLKHSDQAGKIGQFIFNPVGTNYYIKKELEKRDWLTNIPIPSQFNFLGIDIDFEKNGIIAEAQFSNYPFLLNNLLRSELFYKSKTIFKNKATEALVIITKAHMFPASNSTLYYEQAQKQLNELTKYNVFEIPIRLIGLFETEEAETTAVLTEYSSNRYSRQVTKEDKIVCKLVRSKNENGRFTITKVN